MKRTHGSNAAWKVELGRIFARYSSSLVPLRIPVKNRVERAAEKSRHFVTDTHQEIHEKEILSTVLKAAPRRPTVLLASVLKAYVGFRTVRQ